MFTGIIQEVGHIIDRIPQGGLLRLGIQAPDCARELEVDRSIALNGVCLTAIKVSGSSFEVDAVEETLKKTTLGSLEVGAAINLELPMKSNDRLDGHLVLGHVDATGVITGIQQLSGSRILTVEIPGTFERYCISGGSIAIDGISLTIAKLDGCSIQISIIPHTLEKTIVPNYAPGTRVNIEFDVIGKYAERMTRPGRAAEDERTFLTEKHLRELGF